MGGVKVLRGDSHSGVGDELLEGGQRDLALHRLGLRVRAQVHVHHVTSQRLGVEEYIIFTLNIMTILKG